MKEALTHHPITASCIQEDGGPAIVLEQKDATFETSIIVHPWQLVAVCQHFDLIAGGA